MLYYRIKENKLYDYSEYRYNKDCLETEIITKDELQAHPNKVIVSDTEIEIDVPDYDEDGNPIMIEYEDTEIVIDYDEEGNPIGSHEITVIKTKQSTHMETVIEKRLVINPNYEQEEMQKELERIANLHMTRGDVFRGLLLAKSITRADIRGILETMPEGTPQEKVNKEMALIDFDEALEFYRGVSLIDTLGIQLGISSEQMNNFFDTKDWHALLATGEE